MCILYDPFSPLVPHFCTCCCCSMWQLVVSLGWAGLCGSVLHLLPLAMQVFRPGAWGGGNGRGCRYVRMHGAAAGGAARRTVVVEDQCIRVLHVMSPPSSHEHTSLSPPRLGHSAFQRPALPACQWCVQEDTTATRMDMDACLPVPAAATYSTRPFRCGSARARSPARSHVRFGCSFFFFFSSIAGGFALAVAACSHG